MNHLAQIAGGSPAFPGNDARKYTTDKEASPPVIHVRAFWDHELLNNVSIWCGGGELVQGRNEASMDCSGGSLCFKSLQESYLWLEAGAQPLNESLPTTPH
ncbi:hypothetical protein OIU76_014640 [Salix suchowensis]|uniref:Uncharacterized protein n=1 Tax=Salix suchowensis TaxID=1278906 RepID=A0ABQ9BGH1_9ROSI|nr:hypothetical protein OIU76_014640 [Salix suchowensis]KAJ6345043.1 hypothetical protein OIU78_007846 [Salix suchowensis]KAJ6384908.1 hypothetical protein OIU77_028166 [Salix suchowensis]